MDVNSQIKGFLISFAPESNRTPASLTVSNLPDLRADSVQGKGIRSDAIDRFPSILIRRAVDLQGDGPPHLHREFVRTVSDKETQPFQTCPEMVNGSSFVDTQRRTGAVDRLRVTG